MTKRPTEKKFEKAMKRCRGNVTKVAEVFGVNRSTIYDWMNEDPRLKEMLEDARGGLFDDLLQTAYQTATGIPKLGSDGERIGWIEKPDMGMLRYLLGTLGKKEGFGESIDVTTNGKGINGRLNLFRVLTKEEIENFDQWFDENY